MERRFSRGLLALTVLIVVLAVVLGSVALVASYRDDRRRSREAIAAQAQRDASVADRLVRDQLDVLSTLAASDDVRSGDPVRMTAMFDRVGPEQLGFTGGISWTDSTGRLRAISGSDPAQLPAVSFADRDWFPLTARGQRVVGQVIETRVRGTNAVPFAVPTRAPDGTITGTLGAGVLLNRPGRLVAVLGQRDHNRIVVDRAGYLIIGRGPIPERTRAAPGSTPSRAAAERVATVTGARDALGRRDRVVAWAPVPSAGWVVIRSESRAEAFGNDTRRLVAALAGLALLGATVVAVAWLLSRRAERRAAAERAAAAAAHAEEQRSAQLMEVLSRLAALSTRREIAMLAVEEGLEVLGAHRRGLSVLTDADTVLERLYDAGWHPEDIEPWRRHPVSTDTPAGVAAITGQPVVVLAGEVEARFPAAAPTLRDAGDEAWVAMPLLDGTRTIGVLGTSFLHASEADDRTLVLLRLLAERTAAALLRAERQEVEREVTLTFQETLLPRDPGTIEGVQVAGRYQPAHHAAGVGGDWYDAIPLDEHRLVVVIGDVVGRGIRAAAAMGTLRTAARTLAPTQPPAEVLCQLDAMAEHEPDLQCATVLVAVIDARERRLEWASAGHPPAFAVMHDGHVEQLDQAQGPFLGIDHPRVSSSLDLDGVRGIVLYTDGLIERRSEGLDAGLARLERALRAHTATPGRPLPSCDELIAACTAGHVDEDDTAVLTVALALPAPPQLHLFSAVHEGSTG